MPELAAEYAPDCDSDESGVTLRMGPSRATTRATAARQAPSSSPSSPSSSALPLPARPWWQCTSWALGLAAPPSPASPTSSSAPHASPAQHAVAAMTMLSLPSTAQDVQMPTLLDAECCTPAAPPVAACAGASAAVGEHDDAQTLLELLQGGDGVLDLSPLCGVISSSPAAASALKTAPSRKRKAPTCWEELYKDKLARIPNELLPQSTVHGEHSWTVHNGRCTVEVLFRSKALVVKASSTGQCRRRVPWTCKGELEHTWSWLKTDIGWGVPE